MGDILSNRFINPSTKDYEYSNDAWVSMNYISQKVYLALTRAVSKITDKKKLPYLQESTRSLIEAALIDLINNNLITDVVISISTNNPGALGIRVEFTNLTINKQEALFI